MKKLSEFIKSFEWLIFDADNTLYDYDSAEKFALFKTIEDFSIQHQIANDIVLIEYQKLNSKLWKDFEDGRLKDQKQVKLLRSEQLLTLLGSNINPEEFGEKYLVNLGSNTDLLPEAQNVIQTLAKSHKLMIMTNGMTKVQVPRFKYSSIGKYFDEIIISEEVGVSKPNTEIFDIAFELMDHPNKNEVIMIGDSLASDIKGANNYELQSLWFNPKRDKIKHSATHEFSKLIQLIS